MYPKFIEVITGRVKDIGYCLKYGSKQIEELVENRKDSEGSVVDVEGTICGGISVEVGI